MSDKTPKRGANSPKTGFSPVTLKGSPAAASPQKNLTGLPRVVRDLVADLYNTIQKWNDLHVKGATIVKQIATIKSDNAKDFSVGLEQLTNELYVIVQNLGNCKEALLSFTSQMGALVKLQKEPEPLFISLDAQSISNRIGAISEAYAAEFELKVVVLEHVAHSKGKDEAMFLAALWTYQHKITDAVNLKLETLLVETGHHRIR